MLVSKHVQKQKKKERETERFDKFAIKIIFQILSEKITNKTKWHLQCKSITIYNGLT